MTSPPAAQPTTPAASLSPTSPDPSPSPSPSRSGVTARLLGVRPPTPSTTRTAAGSSGDSADDLLSGVGPLPSDPLDTDGSTRYSGTERDDEPAGERDTTRVNLSKKPLRDVLRGGASGAGEFLHEHLATTPMEQDAGVWLMDDDQAAAIADPLASVAGRYAGGQVVDTTVADLIKAGVALAAYLATNVLKRMKIRRAYKRAGYTLTPDEQGETE